MISADDFRLEAASLAEGPPSVEKFQKALQNAYERGLRSGGKIAMSAVESAFAETETEETHA